MKAVSAKDLIVGRVYSDIDPDFDGATFFKFVGKIEEDDFSFLHVGGPIGSYLKQDDDDNYHFTGLPERFPDIELTEQEIEQYLPKTD